PLNRHARRGTIHPERSDHGRGLPMPLRAVGVHALAPSGPTPQPREVGFGAGFVQEDQLGRIQSRLLTLPRAARLGDRGTVLFAGPECLFLYVSPSLTNA